MNTPSWARRLLRKLYLDGTARGLAEGGRRLRHDAGRRFGAADRSLARAYLAANATRKLHIGCGPRVLEGWLNTDLSPRTKDVMTLDATEPFPLPSAAFDFVFSEHMLEHVPYAQGKRMLRECFRVMKPGATIRISTPDLAFLVSLYRRDKSRREDEYLDWSVGTYSLEREAPREAMVVNNFFRAWGHQFIYDEASLRASLEDAGFTGSARRRLNESPHAPLRDLENVARLPAGFLELETLTIESTKPLSPGPE